jgi:hypothetical protein
MMRDRSRLGRSADCREVLGHVTDYLEGALPARRERRLESHLAECAGCLVYLEQIQATIKTLGCLGTDDIPEGVLRRLCGIFVGAGAEAGAGVGVGTGAEAGAGAGEGGAGTDVGADSGSDSGPDSDQDSGSGSDSGSNPGLSLNSGRPPVAKGGQ